MRLDETSSLFKYSLNLFQDDHRKYRCYYCKKPSGAKSKTAVIHCMTCDKRTEPNVNILKRVSEKQYVNIHFDIDIKELQKARHFDVDDEQQNIFFHVAGIVKLYIHI